MLPAIHSCLPCRTFQPWRFGRRVTCCAPAGVSFLEMMAMELKAEGYYVARGLSFRSAPLP